MDHLPFQIVAACCPMIMIDGFVAIDGDEILAGIGCQFAVEVGGCDNGLLILCKTTGGLLDDSKHLVHYFIEGLLVDFQHFFFYLVNLCENVGTLIDRCVLDGGLQFGNLVFLLCSRRLYLLLQLLRTLTEFVIAHGFNLGGNGFSLFHKRLNQFHVA